MGYAMRMRMVNGAAACGERVGWILRLDQDCKWAMGIRCQLSTGFIDGWPCCWHYLCGRRQLGDSMHIRWLQSVAHAFHISNATPLPNNPRLYDGGRCVWKSGSNSPARYGLSGAASFTQENQSLDASKNDSWYRIISVSFVISSFLLIFTDTQTQSHTHPHTHTHIHSRTLTALASGNCCNYYLSGIL